MAEVQTAEGKLCLFVGIDRTAKFAVARLNQSADKRTACEFLWQMPDALPYQVHTVLTITAFSSQSSPGTGTPSTPGRCAST